MALDDNVNARTINIDTTNAVVTLKGTVGSEAERERAVRLAKETRGVTRVEDLLQVQH
jgi:hyperosmotically inducible periplasmic protein